MKMFNKNKKNVTFLIYFLVILSAILPDRLGELMGHKLNRLFTVS